jgi:hypothetical protein
MRGAGIRDARDPIVLSWAHQFWTLPRPARERAILRFAQLAIRYERDPSWYDAEGKRHGVEVFDSPGVVVHRGFADCDAKERFFRALCLACDVPTEIDSVLVGTKGFPHVRSKVWYAAPECRRWYAVDADASGWLVADPEDRRRRGAALTSAPARGSAAWRPRSCGHDDDRARGRSCRWRRLYAEPRAPPPPPRLGGPGTGQYHSDTLRIRPGFFCAPAGTSARNLTPNRRLTRVYQRVPEEERNKLFHSEKRALLPGAGAGAAFRGSAASSTSSRRRSA